MNSCLFITITTKYNVSIYGPKVNPINSDWIEVFKSQKIIYKNCRKLLILLTIIISLILLD